MNSELFDLRDSECYFDSFVMFARVFFCVICVCRVSLCFRFRGFVGIVLLSSLDWLVCDWYLTLIGLVIGFTFRVVCFAYWFAWVYSWFADLFVFDLRLRVLLRFGFRSGYILVLGVFRLIVAALLFGLCFRF